MTRSLHLRAGSTTLTVPPGTALLKPSPAIPEFVVEHIFHVDAPADLRSVTISFEPKGRLTYDGEPLSYQTTGPTSTTLKLSR